MTGQWIVGGHDRTPALEGRLLEQREIPARLMNAGCHKDRVAAFAGQARLYAEIEDDVADHPVDAGARTEHALHRAPLLPEFIPLPVVQRLGLGVEPSVDLVLGPEPLVDVARLIDQVEHHLVLDGLAEFVGVDVAAEYFQAGLPVLLQQRGAGEADEDRVRHHRLHHPVQLAALGAVAFVHEHEHLAHRLARLGLQLLDESLEIIHVPAAELMHQGAEQAWRGLAKLTHQVPPAAGALDRLAGLGKDPLDLFVELVPVSDDGDAGIWVVLQNPLGQQHHDDAFAAALRMPDNAALLLAHMLLGRLDAEILMHARQFFHAAVEHHEVVHQFNEPILAAHLQQVFVERESAVVRLVLLPSEGSTSPGCPSCRISGLRSHCRRRRTGPW